MCNQDFIKRPLLDNLMGHNAFVCALGCESRIAVLAGEYGCGLELGVIYPQQNCLAPAKCPCLFDFISIECVLRDLLKTDEVWISFDRTQPKAF